MRFEGEELTPDAKLVLSKDGPECLQPERDSTIQLNFSSGSGAVDYLTGLVSRERFEEELRGALEQVKTGRLQDACLFFLDLDRFKRVNDTLGHAVGDDLLRLVSDRLRGELDPEDVLARLGGDEFAILLAPAPDRTSLEQLSQRLIDLVQRTYLIEGHVVHVGTSIGIAFSPQHGVSTKELLRRADLALYESKNRGRGAFHFFTPELELVALSRRSLETELRKAIVLRQLTIFYQPQVSVETEEVTGFEALLRWRHPKRGLLLPGDFMPLAEEIGMTVPIGDWVLRTVCSEAKKWSDRFVFAVNVSAQQFEDPAFPTSVRRALVKSGLAGSRLEIEVTEDILLRNDPSAPGTLSSLRELGVLVTLDDFGTGVASLSQLAKLPFDKIKIDRSLIALKREDPKNRAIIRAISALGQTLGIGTHAEGVESLDHLEQVRSDGCQSVQGFFYSEAVPAEQLDLLIQQFQDKHNQKEASNGQRPVQNRLLQQ
jgi:diguanylate cyclase (GGDEF)-like protein